MRFIEAHGRRYTWNRRIRREILWFYLTLLYRTFYRCAAWWSRIQVYLALYCVIPWKCCPCYLVFGTVRVRRAARPPHLSRHPSLAQVVRSKIIRRLRAAISQRSPLKLSNQRVSNRRSQCKRIGASRGDYKRTQTAHWHWNQKDLSVEQERTRKHVSWPVRLWI